LTWDGPSSESPTFHVTRDNWRISWSYKADSPNWLMVNCSPADLDLSDLFSPSNIKRIVNYPYIFSYPTGALDMQGKGDFRIGMDKGPNTEFRITVEEPD
jgi:hypothetical protein